MYAELKERVEAATSSYFATGKFLQIFSLTPFYMTVASYCYYEKVHRTMRTAVVSYLLKYFYSFSAAELNNIESEDKVFA